MIITGTSTGQGNAVFKSEIVSLSLSQNYKCSDWEVDHSLDPWNLATGGLVGKDAFLCGPYKSAFC